MRAFPSKSRAVSDTALSHNNNNNNNFATASNGDARGCPRLTASHDTHRARVRAGSLRKPGVGLEKSLCTPTAHSAAPTYQQSGINLAVHAANELHGPSHGSHPGGAASTAAAESSSAAPVQPPAADDDDDTSDSASTISEDHPADRPFSAETSSEHVASPSCETVENLFVNQGQASTTRRKRTRRTDRALVLTPRARDRLAWTLDAARAATPPAHTMPHFGSTLVGRLRNATRARGVG